MSHSLQHATADTCTTPTETLTHTHTHTHADTHAHTHKHTRLVQVGDAFRTRLRMYPAMVNCCSLDWFSEWPEEALYAVAEQKLSDIEFETRKSRASLLTYKHACQCVIVCCTAHSFWTYICS